jgi:hypothetical protein
MVTKELINYITRELKSQKNPEEIIQVLTGEGWRKEDIESGFIKAKSSVNLPLKLMFQSLSIKNLLLISGGLIITISLFSVLLLNSSIVQQVSDKSRNNTVTIVPEMSGQVTLSQPYYTPVITISKTNPAVTPYIISTSQTNQAGGNSQTSADCGTEDYAIDLSGNSKGNHPHLECFIATAKVCTTAKMTLKTTLDQYGMKTANTISYDIVKSGNTCMLHIYQGNIRYTLPAGITESMLGALISPLKKVENTQGVCIFANNNDLAAIFEKLDGGNISMPGMQGQSGQNNVYVSGSCSGTYFEAINGIYKAIATPTP